MGNWIIEAQIKIKKKNAFGNSAHASGKKKKKENKIKIRQTIKLN